MAHLQLGMIVGTRAFLRKADTRRSLSSLSPRRSLSSLAHQAWTTTTVINKKFPLTFGGELEELTVNWSSYGDESNPVVYVMPSMSHSCHVSSASQKPSSPAPKGWWDRVVGYGPSFGIDLHRFRVISASPLGAPFGTSSPLCVNPATGKQYRGDFPQICPADQARAHAFLLDSLGIDKVHAVVGASMGGMQALEFAVQFPDRYSRVAAICATPHTSPSTVALRSVQRAAVRMDPAFQDGEYEEGCGPAQGMAVARQVGTICYRSRDEFDSRFKWEPNEEHMFEVESYLNHQGVSFNKRYDANCYLLMSKCMDLTNVARDFSSMEDCLRTIPPEREFMLLPFRMDSLIPYTEMIGFAGDLGAQGKKVHVEALESIFGHDAFLKEYHDLNPRLEAFLDHKASSGVDSVRNWVKHTVGHI